MTEKHAVSLVISVDTVFEKHMLFSRERHAYPYKKFQISLRCRELCQEDAVLLGDKMKSPVNQKCCALLCSCFAIKTCNIEANTALSLSVALPVNIEFHASFIFIDSIQCFRANGCMREHFYQTVFSQLIDGFAFRSF